MSVAASTLEVCFEAAGEGVLLRLEHRDWEEFGAAEGNELRARMGRRAGALRGALGEVGDGRGGRGRSVS